MDGVGSPPIALHHQRGQLVGVVAGFDEDQDLAAALVHRRPRAAKRPQGALEKPPGGGGKKQVRPGHVHGD